MHYKEYINIILRDITALGGLVFYVIISILIFLLGNFDLFNRLLIGLLLIYLLVSLCRIFYFKERPKKQSYRNFLGKIDASSFPSMHVSRAFFFLFIFHNYFQNSLVSFILLIIALLVSYSRIHFQKHDYVDLVGGFVVGLVSGYFVLFF